MHRSPSVARKYNGRISCRPAGGDRDHSFVIDGEQVYALSISEHEHITERMATMFGSTMAAVIGAFIFISWLDVLSGFRPNKN